MVFSSMVHPRLQIEKEREPNYISCMHMEAGYNCIEMLGE